MLSSLLAAGDFVSPTIDYHALAPEIVLGIGIVLVILVDLFVDESKRWITATLSGIVLLAALLPVVTLSVTGPDVRSMFDGRYVVDNFSLVMKGLFLLAGYIVVLLSTNEIEEGGYHQGEYYVMLLSSIMGMVMMCSARDLVSVFVALEFLSIPAYMMAAWRKRDRKSNEAGVKYFLLGVFASAVMLYGMSLLYGATGSTKLIEIGEAVTGKGQARRHRGDGHRVRHRRLCVQGQRRAVPHLGPRHLRRRADAGHCVPQRCVEGRRLRRPDPHGLPHVPARDRRVPPVHLGAVGADDDDRQCGRAEADQHRPPARRTPASARAASS